MKDEQQLKKSLNTQRSEYITPSLGTDLTLLMRASRGGDVLLPHKFHDNGPTILREWMETHPRLRLFLPYNRDENEQF